MILTMNAIQSIQRGIVITSDTLISPTVSAENFDLKMYSNNTYTDVIIQTQDVTVSGYNINISTNRIPNTLYVLNATNIPASGGIDIVTKQIFKFLSADDESTEGTASLNNVYTQLKNIGNVLSVDYLLNNQEDYTLKFNPTVYDFNQQKYIKSSQKIVIKNNEIVLESLINQYFTEYKTFYEIINSNVNSNDPDFVNQIHLTFMNNIVKWNSLKGNLSYIELMIGLYAKYTGQNIISIVEDPTANFTYRVSSSIPKSIWNSQIKPYVHPLSWNVVYNEITSNTSVLYVQTDDIRKKMRETWNYACTSYLDAQKYSEQYSAHYKKIKNIYHSSGNIESYNVSAHEHISDSKCSLQNIKDEHTFNMNLGGFITGQTYLADHIVLGMYKELKDKSKISFSFDRFNNTVTLDFGLTGVANQYVYEFYNSNTLYKTIQSPLSVLTVSCNFNDVILLKLVKDNWEQYVCKIDQSAFIQFKAGLLSNIINTPRIKYTNITSGNNKKDYQHFLYNDMCAINFTSETGCNVGSYTNDFSYPFATSASSGVFATEFDFIANFSLSKVATTISGVNYNNTTVTYSKVGIATKYEWSLYISGNLVETLTTYFNTVNFMIPVSDYTNGKIGLKIYYKNGSYSLFNQAVCV